MFEDKKNLYAFEQKYETPFYQLAISSNMRLEDGNNKKTCHNIIRGVFSEAANETCASFAKGYILTLCVLAALGLVTELQPIALFPIKLSVISVASLSTVSTFLSVWAHTLRFNTQTDINYNSRPDAPNMSETYKRAEAKMEKFILQKMRVASPT